MTHKDIKIHLTGIFLVVSAIFTHIISCGEWNLLSFILFLIGTVVFLTGFFVNSN